MEGKGTFGIEDRVVRGGYFALGGKGSDGFHDCDYFFVSGELLLGSISEVK